MPKPTSHETAVQAELEKLRLEQSTRLGGGSAAHRLQRFFVRIVRIGAGLVLVLLAVYSCSTASAKTDIPFAALTLADLAAVVIGYVAAVALLVWACQVAFGEAQRTVRASDATLRAEAESRVAAREQQTAAEAARATQEEERIAAKYQRSKLLGLLFDPGVAKRHKWLPWVAWPLAYLIPLLVVSLFS